MLIYTLDDHSKQSDHVHGRNHFDDAGKPGALKGARRVWRGAFKKGLYMQYLVGCLPYLPELIEPSSRLTTRLRTIVQAICAAFNAKGGARLGAHMGIHLSRMTFLFSLLLLPTPPVGHVEAVGIDDFAWKRGKRYGTVIIDLETHDLLDLLPDREAESVKQWLLAHPEIKIVSRDRGGAYADGAAQGAPQALQIADRWHLCKNIGDAVQEYLIRQKIQMPPLPSQTITTQDVAAVCAPAPPSEPGPCRYASQAKRERKQAIVEQAKL